MNILQYGNNGYFTKELESFGHKVFQVGENSTCDLQLNTIVSATALMQVCAEKGFIADVFLYVDDSTLPHLFFIEELQIPSIFYSIDTYCHDWHSGYARAFDYVLYAQAEEKDKFPDYSEHVPLFANYFSPFETREEWLNKRDIPIAFVGTLGHKNNPDRTIFYSLFKSFMPLVIMRGDFVPIYKRARIVLNQSAVGELNFRTFEAMALGCACLADNMPTEKNHISEIFSFGENSLPTYPRNDVAKAVDYAMHWLSAEKETDLYEIAMKGRELVEERHSAKVRAKLLHQLFMQLQAEKAWKKRLTQFDDRKKHIAQAFHFLSVQPNLNQKLTAIYFDIASRYS